MTDVKTVGINRGTIENAYNYKEYRKLVDDLLDQNQTTGENHSETLLHYTKMNVHRMRMLDRQIELKEPIIRRLKYINRQMIWLILTEGWSGDAAHIVPVIQKMADHCKNIQTRYLLRWENPDVMSRLLMDSDNRSIPRLVSLNSQTLGVLGEWGPRPGEAEQFFKKLKNSEEYSPRNIAEKMHNWYTDDESESLQSEFVSLVEEWENRV